MTKILNVSASGHVMQTKVKFSPVYIKGTSENVSEKWNEWCPHLYEPRHDKTNKVSARPAKTQISLGIRPVWSESSLSA